MLFSARHLAKQFVAGTRGCSAISRVLTDVNFDLDAGRVMGVLGGRASGKTTLLRCVAGLARPDAGVLRWSPAARQPRITALAPAALPFETVRDVIERACADPRVSPLALAAALERLGLAALLHRTQAALTTDERARLALAVALAAGHPLLLLDGTPDTFAAENRPLVRDALHAHTARGGGVLLAGRDPAGVSALAPEVLELRDGRLAPPTAATASPPPARVAERSLR